MIIGNPKVSILLTSYDNPMIKDAIESVLNQTYKNFELILLDDNSNKKTQEIYTKYNDPRIVLYNSHVTEKGRKKECPYARQINVGLKMATGKLITYMCDDTTYLPEKLEKVVKFLKRHPKVRVCYNRQEQKNKKGDALRILASDRILRDPFGRVDHSSVTHYKKCVDKVGDWDTNPPSFALGDAYFWRKLAKEYLFYPILEVLETNIVHDKSFSSKFLKEKLNKKYE